MNSKVLKRFYIAASLYFIIALAFLVLHYFSLERISGVRGDINYIGRSTKASRLRPEKIRNIKVYFNGLELFVTPIHRLKVITSDGITHPLTFEGYSLSDDGIILQFNHEVNLRILSDIHSNKVTLQPDLPLTIPPMERLILPAQWMKGYRLTLEDDLYRLHKGEEDNFYLTMPENTVIKEDARLLDIDVSNNILRDIVLEETLTGSGRTLQDWFEKEGERDLLAAYEGEIQQFSDKTFQSVRSRMDSEGYLNDKAGERYFSEEAINLLLIESLERGLYQDFQSELQSVTSRNRSRLSSLTAVYLGDIVTQGNNMIASDWRFQTQLNSGLSTEGYRFFDYRGLYTFFNSQLGLYRKTEQLENLAISYQQQPDNYLYQLNRLEFLLEAEEDQPDADRLAAIQEQLEALLLDNVFWIKEDLLLFDEQGIAQMEASLRLGKMLVQFAPQLSDQQWLLAGRKMVLSALRYSDNLGYIPESLIFNSTGDPEQIGFIRPEHIYHLLSMSDYRPQRIPLTDNLGAGSWVYTGVSKLSISNTPRETVFNVDFPVDASHHMVIRGIKPFTNIYLHGIRWKSDANFQRYSDGWVYDRQKEILYLKVQHRRPTERIQIRYYSDQEAAAAPVDDAAEEETENAEENVLPVR